MVPKKGEQPFRTNHAPEPMHGATLCWIFRCCNIQQLDWFKEARANFSVIRRAARYLCRLSGNHEMRQSLCHGSRVSDL
jgi:hypothetical protein